MKNKRMVVSHISAPFPIKKRISNIRGKAVLFRELRQTQKVLQHLAPRDPQVKAMPNIFHYVLEHRCHFFEEERVLDASEMTEMFTEDLLVEMYRNVAPETE